MTGIPQSEIYDTAISFLFKGVATKQTFPIASMEAQRIQAALDACDEDEAGTKQFLVFDTMNGWTVAVRTHVPRYVLLWSLRRSE